mmetsp:Transcript_17033/g.39764  ORF Transcript_17033/g.39764 Transcript_17033/m.39764 type:complete len:236 (+) Transcript_17033:152-859(+)
MVLPMPLGGGLIDEFAVQIPGIIRSKYSYFWWALLACCATTSIINFLVMDYIGGFMSLLFGMIVFCMVRNHCERMNQCMLLWLGMLFIVEGLFDFINLCTCLAGRTSMRYSQESIPTDASTSSTVITITSTVHAFFDDGQGWKYNLQSAMFIVNVAVMAIGGVLCYMTYNAFDTGLLSGGLDDDVVMDRTEAGLGPDRPGGYGGDGGGGPVRGGRHRDPGRPQQLFGGQGNRLGA